MKQSLSLGLAEFRLGLSIGFECKPGLDGVRKYWLLIRYEFKDYEYDSAPVSV